MIRLMLQQGAQMVEFLLTRMALEEFTEGVSRDTVERLLEQFEGEAVSQRPFLDGDYGDETRDLAASLLFERYEVSANWSWKSVPVPVLDEDPFRIAETAFKRHRKRLTARSIREIRDQQRHAQGEAEHLRLQTRLMELYRYLRELDPEMSISGDLMNTDRLDKWMNE